MSYNGNGTFVINTAGQPVVTGTVISSTAFNALTADLATGLSTAITKDGQTATTARIPFALGISSTLTTDATSSTTGSIISAGGISCQKALYVGTSATITTTATAASFVPSGSSAPSNGVYLPSANVVGIAANSVKVLEVSRPGSSGANFIKSSGNGSLPMYMGSPQGSYGSVGFNAEPTTTVDTWKYAVNDYAAIIQFADNIETYTTSTGTGGNNISFTAGPYVANLGTSWTNSSDARLKDNFTPVTGVLNKLSNIVVGTYVWSGEGKSPAGRADIGIRAQELYAQFPMLVDKGDDGVTWDDETSKRWGISESKIGIVALQAVKELLEEIKVLKDRISVLEKA